MLFILISFLALVFLIISFFLYKKVAWKLTLPSFTSFFYFYYIIFAFVGALLFVLKIYFPYPENTFSVNNRVLLQVFLLVSGGLIVIGVVMLMVQSFFGFNPKKDIKNYFYKPIDNIVSKRESFFLPFFWLNFFIGLIFIGIILWQARRQIISLPIFSVFYSQLEYLKLRIIIADVLGKRHWLIAGTMLLKLNTYISFIFASLKKTWKWKITFFFFFFLTLSVVSIPGTKGRILFIFIQLILIKFFLDYRKWKLSIKKIKKLYFKHIVIGLLIFISISFILFGYFTENPFLVMNAISKRVFLDQIAGIYHILNLYPDQLNFLYGKGFSNPGGILPYEPVFVSHQIASYLFPLSVRSKTFLSMSTIFYGEAYANFGWIGVITFLFIVGIIIQVINVFFIRHFRKNAITLSVYVILTTEWIFTSFVDLNVIIFWGTADYYLLFIMAFIMYYFPKSLKLKWSGC